MNVLEEAASLVYGDRNADYGHPLDDFTRTGKMWGALLGIEVSPEMVGLMMMCVKISREVNKPKRDNMVDAAGYAATVELVHTEVARRSAELTPGQIQMVEDLVDTGK